MRATQPASQSRDERISGADRNLAQQLALHGNYVVEGASTLTTLPATGSLIIVAPAKDRQVQDAPGARSGDGPIAFGNSALSHGLSLATLLIFATSAVQQFI